MQCWCMVTNKASFLKIANSKGGFPALSSLQLSHGSSLVGGLVGYKLYKAILETYILEVLFYQLIHEIRV